LTGLGLDLVWRIPEKGLGKKLKFVIKKLSELRRN